MKKGIHPDYHFVEVQLNDGSTYKTRTTYGTAGQKITLDIDPRTHPAWTGGQQQLLDRGGRVSRFNSRFGGMNFGKKCPFGPFGPRSRHDSTPGLSPGFFVWADGLARNR